MFVFLVAGLFSLFTDQFECSARGFIPVRRGGDDGVRGGRRSTVCAAQILDYRGRAVVQVPSPRCVRADVIMVARLDGSGCRASGSDRCAATAGNRWWCGCFDLLLTLFGFAELVRFGCRKERRKA